jgi:hypothetical protein
VFTHKLGRTSGSYAGVVTPTIVVENLMKANRVGAGMVVVGGYRKFAQSGGIVSLPGFLLDVGSELYNERGLALILEAEEGLEVKMFSAEPTMDYDKLTVSNLASISTLLEQIYPYSLATVESSALQASQRSTISRRLCDCDENRSHGGYVQVHTQLPTHLACELESALRVLGYSNTTEWIRDMARQTIREAMRP